MDVKEKLVEIMEDLGCNDEYCKDCEFCNDIDGCVHRRKEIIADRLIANGVTVQEWISVKDELPPYNRDVLVYRPNTAMKILVDNYAWHYRDDDDEWYEDWALCGKDTNGNPVVTHWAYLPQPPKGEEDKHEAL